MSAEDPRLVLLRHAEPEADGRVMGAGHDPGLTDRGRTQARDAGRRLASMREAGELPPVVAVRTSGARRSSATAALLGLPGAPAATVDERWAERDLGAWATRRWVDVLDDLPAAATHDPATWDALVPPGGEDLATIRRRVGEALATPHERGTVVVVAHAGPVRSALSHVLDLPAGAAHRVDVAYARAVVLRRAGGVWVVERTGA